MEQIAKLNTLYILAFKKNKKFWGGRGGHCPHVQLNLCPWLIVSFTYTYHLEKFVEKLYIFFVVSFSKSRKRKKENTMNINSKIKKNPGKEIKHLLFFTVGKVAILSTFFYGRNSMYSEV